ncbi:MAG: hypothetical protein QG640_605 [Patescibacteria group bacterium]|nr:hypothetical protein [Patescibacteria group bacterium]
MENFSRGGDRGGFKKGGFKKNFGGGYKGGNRDDRGPVTMHKATCASCGKTCEVPFRPSDGKPVYCRDCFAGRSAMGGDRSFRKDPRTFNSQPAATSQSNPGVGELKKQVEIMNTKLDKLVAAVQELTLKGALKEVTNESKETPKVVEEVKVKKVSKKK